MRTDDPSGGELAERVGRALDQRACSEVGVEDPSAVQLRLSEVRVAAGRTADSSGGGAWRGRADVVDLGPASEGPAGHAHGHQRRATTVLAAASVALLVAVGVGLARWGGSSSAPATPPAPSPSPSPVDPQELWEGYGEMGHPQWPTEERGAALFDDDVVPASVRLMTQLGRYDYWGGFTQEGLLCWTVDGPGAGGSGCTEPPSAPEPVQVSDGSVAPQVWLVPYGTPTEATDSLISGGVLAIASGVWADAGALAPPPPLAMYERFRQAPTAADAVSPDSAIVVRDPLVPDSLRLLERGETGTYYAGYQTRGTVCLFWNAPSGGQSASTCQTPQHLAGEGLYGVSEEQDVIGTAWLVPDDVDTSAWTALGRVQLARNLWFESRPLDVEAPPVPQEGATSPAEEVTDALVLPAPSFAYAPDLAGMTEADASAYLGWYGLEVGTVTAQDAGSAPSGIVLKTSPEAGGGLDEGEGVDLVVSR